MAKAWPYAPRPVRHGLWAWVALGGGRAPLGVRPRPDRPLSVPYPAQDALQHPSVALVVTDRPNSTLSHFRWPGFGHCVLWGDRGHPVWSRHQKMFFSRSSVRCAAHMGSVRTPRRGRFFGLSATICCQRKWVFQKLNTAASRVPAIRRARRTELTSKPSRSGRWISLPGFSVHCTVASWLASGMRSQ